MSNLFLGASVAFLLSLLVFIALLPFRPCPAEDSSFCYWDAETRGNGHGQSFIRLF
jgi:hypothetical protein